MDKADQDDSTPDPEREAEPDRSTSRIPPAVTKAPAPVRSIGGSYVAPKPPAPLAKYLPPAPTGCTTFPAIPSLLATNAEAWGIPPGRLPTPADRRAYAQVIGEELGAGNGRAGGIHAYKGIYVWAPIETWRTSDILNGKRESAAFLALNGEAIRFPFPLRMGTFTCYPFLTCRAVALMFRAENPPGEPPSSVLDGIQEINGFAARPASPRAFIPAPSGQPNGGRAGDHSKGGRPPVHDWERFYIQLAWWGAADHEFEPEGKFRPELHEAMMAWCSEQWGDDAPDERTVRLKIAAFYKGGPNRVKPGET